jgi:RNA polymerase sigma-70 factor, ECF subfamily
MELWQGDICQKEVGDSMAVIIDEDYSSVQQAGAGIASAFEQLIVKYQQKVFSQCYFLLSIREDAEDAAQEVFCNVYKSIGSFKGEAKFSTWLYQVTRNHCLNILNKAARKDMSLEDCGKEPSCNSKIENPVDDCVRSKVRQLEEQHRSVVALVHFDDLSYEEAAKVLECPVGTVRSRLNRALEKLKPMLQECAE